MPALVDLAARRGIWLVEDAAHAHGSSYRSVSAGAFGIASSFSFYPTKVMTSAEGGMIVTNEDRLAEECKIYRDQGKASFTVNAHVRMGYNWRLSEPHAIIGSGTWASPRDDFGRRAIAAIYDDKLRELSGLKDAVNSEPTGSAITPLHCHPEGKRDRKRVKVHPARTLRSVSCGRSIRGTAPHPARLSEIPVASAAAVGRPVCQAHLSAGIQRHGGRAGAPRPSCLERSHRIIRNFNGPENRYPGCRGGRARLNAPGRKEGQDFRRFHPFPEQSGRLCGDPTISRVVLCG